MICQGQSQKEREEESELEMHFLQFESERGQTWPLQRQQLCCSDYDGWVRNGGGFGFKADSLLFKASKGLSPSLGRFAKICQGAAKIGIQRVALRPRPFQRSSTRLRCRRSRVATRCPFIIALQTDTIYILVQALAKLLQSCCCFAASMTNICPIWNAADETFIYCYGIVTLKSAFWG